MTFLVALPHVPDGGRRAQVRWLDIIDGTSTAVQRKLRRGGINGFEPSTMATLLTLFADRPAGFTFFDVGANIGLYGSTCAMLFEPGHVVAFEPTPSTAAVARRISAVNGLDIKMEELALGDEAGEAQLFLSAKSDSSNSLVEGFKKTVGTVTVDVTTMDLYVAQSGLVPDVIKIDAETFEPQILAGAVRTIGSFRPAIVVEALRRRGVDHGEPLNEIMKRLHTRSTASTPNLPGRPDPLSAVLAVRVKARRIGTGCSSPSHSTLNSGTGTGLGSRHWRCAPGTATRIEPNSDVSSGHARTIGCGHAATALPTTRSAW